MTRTRQEMFDIAWAGLEAQGFERSALPNGTCVYRNGNLRCAIGFLISDEDYNPSLEGATPDSSTILRDTAGIDDYDRYFARALQECHDEAKTPADMRSNLIAFAADRGLTLPPSALTQVVNIGETSNG